MIESNKQTNSVKPAQVAVESTSPFLTKVKAYLASRGNATLKQLQSRFKGEYNTCEDYFNILTRNGFTVRGTGNQYSKYTVVA